jgi:flavin reductase (DIM6/NTAB) family NADH-FMN oxidoreductase RutF
MLREATQTMGPPRIAAAPSEFTDAMSALASGVAMVTGWVDRRPWGMTVNTFASVSADPPAILVSLRSDTTSARAIEQAGTFGISILGRNQRDAAAHGSEPGAAKFLERFADRDVEGHAPAIAGALAQFDCDLTARLDVDDHTIFVGRVREVRTARCGEPLVYFRRAYRTLATRGRTPCLSG